MRVLAIESAMMGGSVAILENQTLLAEDSLDVRQRTAQTLSPAMQRLLRDVGWKPRDVELVAVTVGPGSFTGLRIGVTAAKTFAYATGAGVLGVNTLEVLAAQVPVSAQHLWAVINAERAQLFAAAFRADRASWVETIPTGIVDGHVWARSRMPGSLVTGPALADLRSQLPADVQLTAEDLWIPRAATVGQLAYTQFLAGRRDDVWSLVPRYFRESAAEEKTKG